MIANLLREFNDSDEPLPLIISTTDNVYAPCYIVCEENSLISIVVLDGSGHEFGKVLNKDYIVAVEIFYEEMIQVDVDTDEEKMYN
jgi:hypothetical protein